MQGKAVERYAGDAKTHDLYRANTTYLCNAVFTTTNYL
jgi:hypothetical protein